MVQYIAKHPHSLCWNPPPFCLNERFSHHNSPNRVLDFALLDCSSERYSTWFWQEIGTVFQRLLASCSQSLEDSRLLFLRRLKFMKFCWVDYHLTTENTETPYNGRLHGPMVFSATSWKALQWSSGWITSVVGKGATLQENSTKIILLEWLARAAIKHLVISGQLSLSNIILL